MANPEIQREISTEKKKSKLLRLALLGAAGVVILAAFANLTV
jgi:hypothetical protein